MIVYNFFGIHGQWTPKSQNYIFGTYTKSFLCEKQYWFENSIKWPGYTLLLRILYGTLYSTNCISR